METTGSNWLIYSTCIKVLLNIKKTRKRNKWSQRTHTLISVVSFQYYAESHGVIYVIDSTDEERLSESKRAFGEYVVFYLSGDFVMFCGTIPSLLSCLFLCPRTKLSGLLMTHLLCFYAFLLESVILSVTQDSLLLPKMALNLFLCLC